jgi:deoxyribose-phosphate aldolase
MSDVVTASEATLETAQQKPLTSAQFCALVDHTILKPEASELDIRKVCAEARELQTASVCVNSCWVRLVEHELEGSGVSTCSVVGFPFGATNLIGLAAEISSARCDGASEIDMVLPIGLIKSLDWAAVDRLLTDARLVASDAVLKVILETAILNDDEIVAACNFAMDAGFDFVKTSTGFNPAGGATTGAVKLMRATVGDQIGIKASGGIRTLEHVQAMIDAGATRLGMSATVAVAHELSSQDRRERRLYRATTPGPFETGQPTDHAFDGRISHR